jgi:hypothetical protein
MKTARLKQARQWARSLRYLGDRWLLAKPVNREAT